MNDPIILKLERDIQILMNRQSAMSELRAKNKALLEENRQLRHWEHMAASLGTDASPRELCRSIGSFKRNAQDVEDLKDAIKTLKREHKSELADLKQHYEDRLLKETGEMVSRKNRESRRASELWDRLKLANNELSEKHELIMILSDCIDHYKAENFALRELLDG